MERENIIMQYVAVWGWFILAILMFVSAFDMLSIDNVLGPVMFFAFMIGFIFCLLMSWMRRRKLNGLGGESE